AGRLRIVRQLLVEAALIALTAAALSLALVFIVIPLVRPFLPASLPFVHGIGINGRVLAFAFGSALLTSCASAIVPAWRVSDGSRFRVAGGTGRGLSPNRHHRRTVSILVASEVALSVVLLVNTGLMLKSVARLTGIDPGFNASNV